MSIACTCTPLQHLDSDRSGPIGVYAPQAAAPECREEHEKGRNMKSVMLRTEASFLGPPLHVIEMMALNIVSLVSLVSLVSVPPVPGLSGPLLAQDHVL